MQRPFAKYVGCGNDFIFFDNRSPFFPLENRPLIQKLCHRQQGIGADGIILLEQSSIADYRMRIFNADGTEAEMCGNGIRCLMRFLEHLGHLGPTYNIETSQRIIQLSHQGPHITAQIGVPSNIKLNIPIQYKEKQLSGHFLNTGVPHLVFFVDDIETIDLATFGPFMRHHSLFNPHGTNVNLAQILSPFLLKVRTYERGVEAETLACGTGAAAVALAAHYLYQQNSPISVETRLKERLTISFKNDTQGNVSEVNMAGPAFCSFQGTVYL